jgi:hypothetical protein
MATVVLNQVAVTATAQRFAKPLVNRVAAQTLTGAQRLARRGDHRHGSGRRQPGSSLLASLHKTPTRVTPIEVFTSVGTDKRYGASEELGSQAHRIRATSKLLTFRWERGNFSTRLRKRRTKTGFFLFREVVHPGNKRPQRYLRTPLIQFGRASNFKVKMTGVSRRFLP